ncbi:helix-turn-helix domain-containing protein [Malaciobacter mytili]|uniref:LexA family transcriptional regulator n=1 Tax=Malaciobacter mytili TaxID=603050 RepID=UPI003BB11FC9
MSTIYEALLRIEELYNCKNMTDTADLLGMPKNTFYDNKRKAKADFDKIQELENETNPIKRDILKKAISNNKQKHYSNALYHQFIELAIKDNLNLNWIFNGDLPIHNDSSEKIAKIVQSHYLKEYVTDDTVAVPYFQDIKASAGNGYFNSEDDEPDFIVLPKTMIKGKNINALRVHGDSMAPNIKPDSIIFIDLSKKKLKKACVYVVRYEDEVYVKRLEELDDHILLRSDNISYSTITAKKEDVHIIGQVVNSMSTGNIE